MSIQRVYSDRNSDNFVDVESGLTLKLSYSKTSSSRKLPLRRVMVRAGLTGQYRTDCSDCKIEHEFVYSQNAAVPSNATPEEKAKMRAAIVAAQAAYLKAFDTNHALQTRVDSL